MDITSKSLGIIVTLGTALGWVTLAATSGHRIVAGSCPEWVMAVTLLAAVLAITGTLALLILKTIPTVFQSWTSGAEYGRRVEAERRDRELAREAVPSPRVRSLHRVE